VRRKVAEWVPAAYNLHQIMEIGIESWLREQIDRQTLLESLLQDFNEGRSMSLYCKVCARMPIDLIREAVKQARERFAYEKVDPADVKSKARIFKSIIEDSASEGNIDLK
jgi:hypothetical protein